MKAFLIFHLTVAVYANHSVPYEVDMGKDGPKISATGQTNSRINNSNIVYALNGTKAADGQFPWIVSLLRSDRFFCGGSIINTRTILTAAHCVKGLQDYRIDPSELKIRIGSIRHNAGGYIVGVSQIKIHNSYIYDYSRLDYDIALLITASEIPINDQNVKLVQLAKQEPTPGTIVTVAGWGGINKEATNNPVHLYWTNIKIMNRTKCKEFNNKNPYFNSISDRMICGHIYGSENSACYGDSGGPLTQNDVQVGIASWGGQCVWPNHPGVYVNVVNLIPWINSNKF